MKKISFLLVLAGISFICPAQTVINDSVTMNAGYQDDVFYSLYSGSKATAPINEWDLAFTTNAMEVGIRVNSINGVSLWAIPVIDTTNWLTVDTAGYQAWQELNNTDSLMYYGAFNINATSNMFDFSWGIYDFNTHEVIGDSLFLIRLTDNQGNPYFKKLWIVKRADNSTHDWIIRYANIDNTGDTTVSIQTTPYTSKNFIYYSINSGNITDREPVTTDWDLHFTRYTTDIGGGAYYPVMGVYSNYGVQVADVRPVDVASTNSDAPYLNLYSENMDEIGYDWKNFNMTTSMWDIEDSLVYFVRTNAGEVYKLVMTGFDGASTGNIYFNKTLVSTTDIHESVYDDSKLIIYPNPANDLINIIVTSGRATSAEFNVYDLNGRLLVHHTIDAVAGMNKSALSTGDIPAGVYMLQVRLEGRIINQKLVVK